MDEKKTGEKVLPNINKYDWTHIQKAISEKRCGINQNYQFTQFT